jgi:hypothetical protein
MGVTRGRVAVFCSQKTAWALLLILATAFASRALVAEPDAKPRVTLLVPAYFYPAGDGLQEWDRLLAAADRVPIVAIVNPASGPDKAVDTNYEKLLARAKKAKRLTLLGYVTTSYAKRPAADVKADVDTWLRLYPAIQGIFFDEQASAAEHVDYQAELYQHVRKTRGLSLVVTNPGTTCDERFVARPAADSVCLFEGPKPFSAADFPRWRSKYAADQASVLSYKIAGKDEMRRLIDFATKEQLGYCYVTDADGANPWDRLPSYWDDEVAAAAAANAR